MTFESNCRRIWSSRFFRRLGSAYWQRWPRGPWKAGAGEVVLDRFGHFEMQHRGDPFLSAAIQQFDKFVEIGFGIRSQSQRNNYPFRLVLGKGPSHPEGFTLEVGPKQTILSSRTDRGLAQGLFHVERMMELHGAPILPTGKQTFVPRFDLRLHCDVWGGYTVTPRWLDVPRRRETFLLMARHGINATQIRAKLGDFFHDPRYPEISNHHWRENLNHLRQIVKIAGESGLSIILHADNFRLPPDHPLFRRKPRLKGTPIFTGVICPICTGSEEGLGLIARGWEHVFREVPGLGGMIAIVGGECFTHCAMRPVRDANGRNPCPRCGLRHPADVAADLINTVAERVHGVAPGAKILAWPYSAESKHVWNASKAEMERFIWRLRNDTVYVLEIEKEATQPVRGAPGVFRHIWDYSSSFVGPSSRFRHQTAIANRAGVRICVKTETLQAWEAGFMPYLPVMDHWVRRWTLLRKSPARDIHMGWPLYGFNDGPPIELATWQMWNPAPNASKLLDQLISRDFGAGALRIVRKAYRLLGEALEMLPIHLMGYYSRIQFMGSANPLLLRKDEKLDDAFLGFHFYEGEGFSTQSDKVQRRPLPYETNLMRPQLVPEGRDPFQVTAECVRRTSKAWDRALTLYESVERFVPGHRRLNFVNERRILRHLSCMWRTWANAEEFYLFRSRAEASERDAYSREDLASARRRAHEKMLLISQRELMNSKQAWANLHGDDRLNLSLRLDTPTVPMSKLYRTKIRHTGKVIRWLEQQLRGV